MARFDGRVAVITGGGAGLGLATARAFAAEGAKVMLCDWDAATGEAACADIRAAGGDASFHRADVSQGEQMAALMQATTTAYGRLDILFNNAGVSNRPGSSGQLTEITDEAFDAIMAINVRGVWLGMKHAIPIMVAQGSGAIVNVSSNAGLVGLATMSAYSASKHAVLGLTKSAALEFGQSGVRVNAVCPGVHATAMGEFARSRFGDKWPERLRAAYPATGRIGEPREVAEAVMFLCSDAASNIHGVALPIDGGFTAQ